MTLLPTLTEASAPFWQAGRDHLLKFLQCKQCSLYLHPPAPVCRSCFSRDVSWQAVSGFGTIESFTIPVAVPPALLPEGAAAIAIIALDEQPDLKLTSNIIGCAGESVRIGLRVRLRFLNIEDVYLPLFEVDT